MSLRSEECMAKAAEDARQADQAEVPEIRQAFQTLAEAWSKLARDFQMQEAGIEKKPS